MLKIRDINLNYDIFRTTKDDIFISDNKLVHRYSKDGKVFSCLYDFTESQNIINKLDIKKQYAYFDTNRINSDIISNLSINEDRDIEIDIAIFVNDLNFKYTVKPIPYGIIFDDTYTINVIVDKLIKSISSKLSSKFKKLVN